MNLYVATFDVPQNTFGAIYNYLNEIDIFTY